MNESAGQRHYLDWASTAIPEKIFLIDKVVSENPPGNPGGFPFGNPSSSHTEGQAAKDALESARSRCARVLAVEPETLYFTSGGTESNALILHSFLLRKDRRRLLYSAVEHPSIVENCRALECLGLPVSSIPVEKDGRVSAETLSGALEKYPEARFAAIMGVNNETGSLMDIDSLISVARLSRAKNGLPVHFHCDLVQAIGKVPVNIGEMDSASFSAHKLGGMRGIGLLYLKKKLKGLYSGGGQEGGVRPGTENTLGALSLAEILELRAKPETVRQENEKARERFKYLIGELRKIKRCALIPEDRKDDDPRFSPWIIQLRFRDVPGAVMVRALDKEGVAVSTGSACSSNSPERPVLQAMGVDGKARLEGIRVSQGWSTDMADLDALLAGIEKVLSFL
jgi:cysteine desulfurase